MCIIVEITLKQNTYTVCNEMTVLYTCNDTALLYYDTNCWHFTVMMGVTTHPPIMCAIIILIRDRGHLMIIERHRNSAQPVTH